MEFCREVIRVGLKGLAKKRGRFLISSGKRVNIPECRGGVFIVRAQLVSPLRVFQREGDISEKNINRGQSPTGPGIVGIRPGIFHKKIIVQADLLLFKGLKSLDEKILERSFLKILL